MAQLPKLYVEGWEHCRDDVLDALRVRAEKLRKIGARASRPVRTEIKRRASTLDVVFAEILMWKPTVESREENLNKAELPDASA